MGKPSEEEEDAYGYAYYGDEMVGGEYGGFEEDYDGVEVYGGEGGPPPPSRRHHHGQQHAFRGHGYVNGHGMGYHPSQYPDDDDVDDGVDDDGVEAMDIGVGGAGEEVDEFGDEDEEATLHARAKLLEEKKAAGGLLTEREKKLLRRVRFGAVVPASAGASAGVETAASRLADGDRPSRQPIGDGVLHRQGRQGGGGRGGGRGRREFRHHNGGRGGRGGGRHAANADVVVNAAAAAYDDDDEEDDGYDFAPPPLVSKEPPPPRAHVQHTRPAPAPLDDVAMKRQRV